METIPITGGAPTSVARGIEEQPESQQIITIQNAWNEMAMRHQLPLARSVAGQRLTKLRARMKAHGAQVVLDAIRAVPDAPFLLGQNDRGWQADFDFLVQDKSFSRIIEGTYARLRNRGGTQDRHQERSASYAGGAIAPVLARVMARNQRT